MTPHRWERAVREMPLDKPAKAVAYALASRMNRGGSCWPGKTRLASDTGYSVRTVDQAVRRLELLGLIGVRRRPPAPNLYTARLPRSSCGVTPQLTTDNPAATAGEELEEENQGFAYAIQVDQAMLELAHAWLIEH